jgi:hypothetical protein
MTDPKILIPRGVAMRDSSVEATKPSSQQRPAKSPVFDEQLLPREFSQKCLVALLIQSRFFSDLRNAASNLFFAQRHCFQNAPIVAKYEFEIWMQMARASREFQENAVETSCRWSGESINYKLSNRPGWTPIFDESQRLRRRCRKGQGDTWHKIGLATD